MINEQRKPNESFDGRELARNSDNYREGLSISVRIRVENGTFEVYTVPTHSNPEKGENPVFPLQFPAQNLGHFQIDLSGDLQGEKWVFWHFLEG